MLTTTLRTMVAHKLRLLLTAASIALGVALLAGTLVLTNTMGVAFDQLFGKISAGTDAVVRTEAPYTATEGVGTTRGPIAASVLDEIRAVDGVRAAEGSVQRLRAADRQRRAGPSPPTVALRPTATACRPTTELRGDVELLSGRAPTGAHEVAIDATSAEDHDIALGSTIKVLFQGPTRSSPSSAPSATATGSRTSAAPRRRTSTATTAQEVLGDARASSTRSTSAPRPASRRPSSPSGSRR